MGTFSSFGLNQAYDERYEKLGDRLSDVGKTLDWDVFRPVSYTHLTLPTNVHV